MSSSTREQMMNHAKARSCQRLREKGLTHRQIAEQVGIKPEQVKGLIALAYRLRAPEGAA